MLTVVMIFLTSMITSVFTYILTIASVDYKKRFDILEKKVSVLAGTSMIGVGKI